MKKLIPLFLAVLLLLSACGNNNNKKDGDYDIILVSPTPEISENTKTEPDESTEAQEPVNTPAPSEAPVETPAPSQNPEPTAEPTPKPVLKVTKSPTGETLTEGMTTWFIARADNADSITWEFLDASGNTVSMDEAKSQNKGLALTVYDNGETIELNNVPKSMNGWGVRAKFTGCGTSEYSGVARLTVNAVSDFYSAYSSVFDNYKALASGGSDTYGLSTDLDVAEVSLGYMIKDIDGDGVSELMIGAVGDPEGIVYSLFTLENGKPLKVFKSNARDRFYFTGAQFVNQGSSGASYSDCYLCSYSKGEINIDKGVYSTDGALYYVSGGDRNTGVSESIGEDQFNAVWVSCESSITPLSLLPLA